MDPSTRLAPFRAITERAVGSTQSTQKIVQTGDEHDLEGIKLYAPKSPPSNWSKLIGFVSTPTTPLPHETDRPGRSARLEFRSALAARYGAHIAEAATFGQPSGDGDLTVGDVRQALKLADRHVEILDDNLVMVEAQLRKSKDMPDIGAVTSKAMRELVRLLVGPQTLIRPMDAKRVANEVLEKSRELAICLASPGMTPARSLQIIKIASMCPNIDQAVQVIKDLAGPLHARRAAFDSAAVSGAFVADLVPSPYVVRGNSTWATAQARDSAAREGVPTDSKGLNPWHAAIAQKVSALPHEEGIDTFRTEAGASFSLAKDLFTDIARTSIWTIKGKALKPGEVEAQAREFRAQFPAGTKGDQMALLGSWLMTQQFIGKMTDRIFNEVVVPNKLEKMYTIEATPLDNGQWSFRQGHYQVFSVTAKSGTPETLPAPAAFLSSLEVIVDPGQGDGEAPTVLSVSTDVVFNSPPGQLETKGRSSSRNATPEPTVTPSSSRPGTPNSQSRSESE